MNAVDTISSDERRNQRPAERLGRLAVARHIVAVPQQRYVIGLSWDPVEDCGETPSIGPRHIDRGEHDDGGLDRHIVGEGQRQYDAHHDAEAWHDGNGHADNQTDYQHRQIAILDDVDRPL